MKRLLGIAVLLGLGVACLDENPCDAYVEYMCECHTESDDECESLQLTYEVPSSDVQEQCVIDLEEQELDDEEAGFCELDGSDTDSDI